ncbi:M48 family metalloprotease [Candidatus Beckwithbacteria bacterium]|nr:M48 family metalloprotease [Candidatus Beckwithbacteria bacterium]
MAETSGFEQINVSHEQQIGAEVKPVITTPEIALAEKTQSYLDPRIGKVHKHYQETYSLSDESTPEGAKLAEIAGKLENDEFKGKIKYRIINHPQINAFALGDTVYVFSGLLGHLQTTSEVASVLAHEITHIEKGDTEIHDSTNDPDSAQEAIARFAVPRIQEYTADAMVVEKLDSAGYNPTSY